jgi:hypothetical protein
MIFMVEGEVRSFVPIQTFRAEWGLPSTFSTLRELAQASNEVTI